jgi:membrane protease YdiL (CAAX protease family)
MINIALIGIILGLIYIITNNIWVVAGIHCMWNYAQGIIYGINVSGIIVSKSLLKSTSEGSELLTGGSFGAECSIFATIISLVFIGLIFLYIYKKKMIVKN